MQLGDKLSKVSPERNLKNMYLDQLDWLIDDANQVKIGDQTWSVSLHSQSNLELLNQNVSGVYATAPYLPLQLLVRVLSNGSS